MNAFLIALFGAVCWGLAPLFGKVGLRGVNPIDGIVARTAITVLFVGGWAAANGSFSRLSAIPTKRWMYLAIEAFFATFAGDLAYYASIKRGDIGQTSLVLASSPLITMWVGWYFLGESLTFSKIAGAAFIIIGVILVGFKTR
ncbi:MAG TPA: transporter [Firmicutes bacterium]|jgi:bacterial/archaeal transporter family protein|nr:transporter [Bacillota bacterium]